MRWQTRRSPSLKLKATTSVLPGNPGTSRTGSLHPVVLFSLLLVATALPSLGQIERNFDIGSGGALRLSADSSSVAIDATGSDRVTVKVERQRSAEPIDKDYSVVMEQDGSSLLVKVEKRSKLSWGRNNGLRIKVTVPRQFDLDLSTSGGSIKVTDLKGEVLSHTSGGSITLGKIQGRVEAETSGGSITLAASTVEASLTTSGGSITAGDVAGNVRARTSGGSIQIQRADGDVDLSTSGGSITLGEIAGAIKAETSGGSVSAEFTSQPTATSSLATSGGSVRVKLAPGLGFDLDARASSGITADVPITVRGKVDRRRLEGKLNGGGPDLILRASGGKIVISER